MTTDIKIPDGVDTWEPKDPAYITFKNRNGHPVMMAEFNFSDHRDYCLHAAREYPAMMKRVGELESLVRDFAECEVEYMRINNLGDGEKQHNVKRARALLESRT